MDFIERIAKTYLDSLGFGEVIYEPDGNIPPDFLLDGRIAVEVTRLNQNFEQDGKFTGLEDDAAALVRMVEKLLPKYGPARDGAAWWVFYTFRRPLDRKAIKSKLPKALSLLSNISPQEKFEHRVTPCFSLELTPATNERTELFTFAGYADRDAGGWVASEVIRNLNLRIPQKEKKIENYRTRYDEWWLVLPDLVGASLNMEERSLIPQHVSRGSFDRVILLDPLNPLKAFEI